MVAILLIVAAVSFLRQADASVKCFECVDMPHPQDCPTITTCTSHEICYVEQFVTSGGQVLYNSGCLSKARCTSGGKRAVPYGKHYFQRLNNLANENEEGLVKRQNPVSVTDIATCIQCCDGNFCNVEGCGTTAVARLNRGPKCFSCPAQADPESCRDTMQCDRDQVCAIYRPLNRLAFDEWATECMGELQCTGIVKAESMQLSHLAGKRDLLSVNKCPRCCTDDLCNYSCRQNLTVSHSTAIPKPPTHPTTHSTTHPTTKAAVHHTHPTTKPTTKAAVHHTHPTTHPTTKAAVHHTHPTTIPTTKAAVHHNHPTTKPTTKAPVHHTHPTTHPTTKPTTKPTVHHTHPTTHPTTKPTTKSTVHHTHPTTHPTTKPTTKPTVHHTHPTTHPTTKPTTILTTTTPPPPTTDPAIGCKIDGYIYDPPTKLCLKFYESPKLNWTEAQQHCNSTKGKLAIITDDQKIKDVLNFYKHFGYTSPLWVGATDFGNGHVFTFTDGSKLTVDPAEGQDLRNSNCLYVTGGSYKGFGPCSDKHGFICERSSTIRA